MQVRKLKIAAAAALMAATGLAAQAVHAEGLYVGATLGAPHFGDGLNGISGHGSGVSGKVFAGYQLNPYFAVEGGVSDLGRISNGMGNVNGHGIYLDAVGLAPLGANFSLLGSLGVAHVNLNTSNGDDAGVGVKLGVGAEYTLSRQVSLRGEYENYRPATFGTHPSIGQYTVGLRVGF